MHLHAVFSHLLLTCIPSAHISRYADRSLLPVHLRSLKHFPADPSHKIHKGRLLPDTDILLPHSAVILLFESLGSFHLFCLKFSGNIPCPVAHSSTDRHFDRSVPSDSDRSRSGCFFPPCPDHRLRDMPTSADLLYRRPD